MKAERLLWNVHQSDRERELQREMIQEEISKALEDGEALKPFPGGAVGTCGVCVHPNTCRMSMGSAAAVGLEH